MKRPTRYKAEVVDRATGTVLWEVLTHDAPDRRLTTFLASAGMVVRRASQPDREQPLPLVYSELDPDNSVRAAREHDARHPTQVGSALMLLLDRRGQWVPRDDVRAVAGDSGDRRVRELRQRNWPIEIRQLTPGAAWYVRLPLPGDDGQPVGRLVPLPPDGQPDGWSDGRLFG